MRKAIAMAAALLFVGATTAMAQGVITGSEHDFKGASWNSTGEICIVCHAAHGNQNPTGELLWNRTASSATYIMYSNTSGTFQAIIASTPNAESKVCLSCHDGTIALESFGGNGKTTTTLVTGDALISNDLSNDHPISFYYDNALAAADGDLANPGDNGTGPTGVMPLFGTDYRLECASCHDVHNNVPAANKKLLYIDNAASALCLTCHTK